MYYLHKDFQNNYHAITDEQGTLKEELSFDPWGRRRNPTNWTFNDVPDNYLFDRGYTGHEHLDEFSLINPDIFHFITSSGLATSKFSLHYVWENQESANMNGRVYDPVIGKFLSPDNFVQESANSQNFNRYSYCLNNPLIYSDPDGEWFGIDDGIAFLIGGTVNLGVNIWQGNIDNFGEGLAAFGAGGAAGTLALYGPAGWAAGGAIVGGTNAWIGGAASFGDIAMGAGVGAFSGIVGGAVGQYAAQGLGGVVINGFNVTSPVLKGIIGGAIGGAAGGYAGGFTGGLLMTGDLNTAHQSGINGLITGAPIGAVAGGVGGYAAAKKAGINPWTSRPNSSVTIGEGMKRVGNYADDLRSEIIPRDMPEAYFGDEINSTYTTSDGMQYNARWIEMKMQSDYYIYDIGSKGSAIKSPYYNMEVGRTMIYPKIYNVYHIQQIRTIRVLIIHK